MFKGETRYSDFLWLSAIHRANVSWDWAGAQGLKVFRLVRYDDVSRKRNKNLQNIKKALFPFFTFHGYANSVSICTYLLYAGTSINVDSGIISTYSNSIGMPNFKISSFFMLAMDG